MLQASIHRRMESKREKTRFQICCIAYIELTRCYVFNAKHPIYLPHFIKCVLEMDGNLKPRLPQNYRDNSKWNSIKCEIMCILPQSCSNFSNENGHGVLKNEHFSHDSVRCLYLRTLVFFWRTVSFKQHQPSQSFTSIACNFFFLFVFVCVVLAFDAISIAIV